MLWPVQVCAAVCSKGTTHDQTHSHAHHQEMQQIFSRQLTAGQISTLQQPKEMKGTLTPRGRLKSKRRRSGPTALPCCATPSPSTPRSAACSRCVAVWCARVRRRAAASTAAVTCSRSHTEVHFTKLQHVLRCRSVYRYHNVLQNIQDLDVSKHSSFCEIG